MLLFKSFIKQEGTQAHTLPTTKSQNIRDILPLHSNSIITTNRVMSFDEVAKEFKTLLEQLKDDDVLLSGIGYIALVTGLYFSVETIAWILSHTGWTFHQTISLSEWRYETILWTSFTLCIARIALRWRGHLPCTRGHIKHIPGQIKPILRWLSPLSPKPLEACMFCQTATQGEPASSEDHQHQPQHQNQIIPSSSPTSPATTHHDERFAYYIATHVTLPVHSPADNE